MIIVMETDDFGATVVAIVNTPVRPKIFDENNVNWSRDAISNEIFLRGVSNHAWNVLSVRGHLFLNDVYDMIGFDRTSSGAIMGWTCPSDKQESGIIFKVVTVDGPAHLITFEPEGVILDKI